MLGLLNLDVAAQLSVLRCACASSSTSPRPWPRRRRAARRPRRSPSCWPASRPDEVPVAVAFLSGSLTQRQIGVGWALLRDRPAPAAEPRLTLAEVDAAFAAVGALSGPGSQSARRAALAGLLARADAAEQDFLVRLLLGDLAQGALGGVMADAVAKAAGVPRRRGAPRAHARRRPDGRGDRRARRGPRRAARRAAHRRPPAGAHAGRHRARRGRRARPHRARRRSSGSSTARACRSIATAPTWPCSPARSTR